MTDELYAAAKQLDASGNTKVAAQLYYQCLLKDPYRFDLLRDWCFAMANHDRAEVIFRLEGYIKISEDDIRTAKLRLLQLPYLESMRREGAGQDGYSGLFAGEKPFVYSEEEADRFAYLCAKAPDENESALHLKASARFIKQDYPDTQRWLDRLRESSRPTDGRVKAVRLHGPWFEDIGDTFEARFMPRVFRLMEAQKSKDRRIFVGCDLPYVETYVKGLAKSLAMSGTAAHLHLHLFDCTAQEAQVAGAFLSETLGGAFALSFETGAVKHSFFPHRRFYYAPARIMRMYQFCSYDAIPTLMLDADLLVNLPLKPVFDRLMGVDAIICRMPGRIPYHTQANASVFAINTGSTKGMLYLRRIAGYIEKTFRDGMAPWCLDQIAIYCTFMEMLSRPDRAPLVAACGPTTYNGSWNDDVALWPAKCAAGHEQRERWENAQKRFQLTVEK